MANRNCLRKGLFIGLFLCGLLFAFTGSTYAAEDWDDFPHNYGLTEYDLANTPDPNVYPYFAREIPVLIASAATEKTYVSNDVLNLSEDFWVWGELWTGPGFARQGGSGSADPSARNALGDTFIKTGGPNSSGGGGQAVAAVSSRVKKSISGLDAISSQEDQAGGATALISIQSSGLPASKEAMPAAVSTELAQKALIPYGNGRWLVGSDKARGIEGVYHMMIYVGSTGENAWKGVQNPKIMPTWDQNPSTWQEHSQEWADQNFFYRGRKWHQSLCWDDAAKTAWPAKFVPGMSVVAWYDIPLVNLVSVSIETDVTLAEPGETYSGTVRFKNDSTSELKNVPVAVYVGQNGTDIPVGLKNPSWEEIVEDNFAPGEEKTYTFEWSPWESGEVWITGIIDTEPLENRYTEITEDDNKLGIIVPVERACTDISVVSPFGPTGVIPVGTNAQIGATVKRANDGPNGAVQVKVTATGPGFNEISTIRLNKGGSQRVTFTPQVNAQTTTFRIKAEPIGVEDCAPGNNQTSITVNAIERPDLTIPDSPIWPELVHTR